MRIIAGTYKRRTLLAPQSGTRPSSDRLKVVLFDTLQNICTFEDATVCDLFAGSGALGLEALSRGTLHTDFIENNRFAAAVVKKNIDTLGVESKTTIFHTDVFSFLRSTTKSYDIIFADPPYDLVDPEKLWNTIRTSKAIQEESIVVIEHSTSKKIETKEAVVTKKVGDSSFTILVIKNS